MGSTACPGQSIGRDKVEGNNCSIAGSLAGFLRHKNDIYSLTCRHVAFPTPKSNSASYRYEDGKEKLNVFIPASKDHEATKRKLEDDLDFARKAREFEEANQADHPGKDCSRVIRARKLRKDHLDTLVKAAENYEINAGHIFAAPEA